MRGWRRAYLINVALVGVIVALAGFVSTRWTVGIDATAGARASLPAPLQALLADLPGALVVTSYASPASGLKPTVAGFVARYRRFKPELRLAFVDPELDPQAMREAGISVDGEIVLAYQGRTQHIKELSDQAFGNALARLARGGTRRVAFVTGNGERRADGRANADLGVFVGELESRGVEAVPLDFSVAAAVPESVDLVVLASPLVALAPAAVDALVRHLARGGNLLWLDEPDPRDLGLAPLRAALGIAPLEGVLVDGSGAALGIQDPRMLAVSGYPPTPITRGFALTTLFPQARAFMLEEKSPWQGAVLLQSGAQSWNETTPIDRLESATIAFDEGGAEVRGPLAFGYTLTRPMPHDRGGEQRVIVLGDGDFVSNSFIGNGGNRALGERIFDWLLGDDVLAALPPRAAPDRSIVLTQARLNAVAVVFLGLVPLVLLGIGGWRAWRRQRR